MCINGSGMLISRDYGDGRNFMVKVGKENDLIERIRRFFGGEIYFLKVKKKILKRSICVFILLRRRGGELVLGTWFFIALI